MSNKWLPWILTAFITVLVAIFGYTINRLDMNAIASQQIYLTKDQYNLEQNEICIRLASLQQRVERIDEKAEERVQRIIDLLLQQDRAAVKRDKER